MKAAESQSGAVEALGLELGPVKLTQEQAGKVREGYEALLKGQTHPAQEVHAEMLKLIGQGE